MLRSEWDKMLAGGVIHPSFHRGQGSDMCLKRGVFLDRG